MAVVKASVIIPNWNGKELLPDCFDSLSKQTFKDFEIILVDNASTDGSVDYVRKIATATLWPRNDVAIKIVENKKNLGFAGGINSGVKKSRANYVVFLNNDTAVDKNWLKCLVECADKHPEVFSVNPKLLNFYDKKLIDGVGIQINEVGQARSIGWNEKDTGLYEKEAYIFGATGGASLFRREEFIELGMFDASFFMYSEEVDLAFRAQFAEWKSIYCPKAVVFHKHKATSKKLPQHVEYWQFRNMMATIIKDFPSGVLLKDWRWLKIILVYYNTVFYQLKNGFIWPPILTKLWLLWNLPRLLSKRSQIQRSRRVSNEYLESFLKPKPITFWGLRN